MLELFDNALTRNGLTLRPWSVDDFDELDRACADPKISRFTNMPPPCTAKLRAWARHTVRPWTAERYLRLAICDSDSGKILGNVGFVDYDYKYERAEIGYWLLPSARGLGVAQRAIGILLDWAFDKYRVEQVDAFIDKDNDAAKNTASAVGFTPHKGPRVPWVYANPNLQLQYDLFTLCRATWEQRPPVATFKTAAA